MKVWSRIPEDHRSIVRGIVVVGGLLLAGKVVSAAKEVAMAWRYGVSTEVDAYLLALAITTWLPVIISSVTLVIFVPRIVGLGEQDRRQLSAELNALYLATAVFVCMVTAVFGPVLVQLISGNLSAQTLRLAEVSTLVLSPISGFIVLVGYFSMRLQAQRKFGYTFYEAAPAAFIFLMVLLLPGGTSLWPVLLGTLVGFAVQLAILLKLTSVSDGRVGSLKWPDFSSDRWRKVAGAIFVVMTSQVISGLNMPIDTVFAANVGDSAIATLGYSERLIALATALGATAIARAVLPVFSSAFELQHFIVARKQAYIWVVIMFAVGFVAAIAGWLFAPSLVSLVFERGAFRPEDTMLVSSVFQVSVMQLPFFFANVVVFQWMAAIKRLKLLFVATVSGMLAKILILVIFGGIGILAVPLSVIAFYATAAAAGMVLLTLTTQGSE